MVRDYYKLLGIKRTATNAEVHQAYRQQTKLWRSRLNAPDLKLRQEAEEILVELDAAKNAILNTKSYDVNYQKKKTKSSNKKKFNVGAKIKLAFKILRQGLLRASKYVLKVTGSILGKIIKAIAIAVGVILLLCLLFSGLGGAIQFVISIYENQLAQAFIWLMYTYVAMSVVTFFKYWEDKRKAERGIWRTSEAQLHSLELLGGWFGGFLAQVLLHHKSSKESYQLVYWLIVLFHASLFLFFLPLISPFAIPQKYIVIVNALLLIISLDGIRKKGVMN